MDQTQTQNANLDLENLDTKQSVWLLWQLLNKAQAKGIYNIDESCAIKAAVKKITTELKLDDK